MKMLFEEVSPRSAELAQHRSSSGFPSDAGHHFHAQDQLHCHACTETGDLRNSGQFGVVAKNPSTLSLHPVFGAQSGPQHRSHGSAAFMDSDLVDLGTNHRPQQTRNSFSPSKSVDQRDARGLDLL